MIGILDELQINIEDFFNLNRFFKGKVVIRYRFIPIVKKKILKGKQVYMILQKRFSLKERT